MGCPSARPTSLSLAARLAPGLRVLAALLVLGALALAPRSARADRNDLRLMGLCDYGGGATCPWVRQTPTSTVVNLDAAAGSRFRSLMSELGVAIAPRLQTPADTLGFAGFQFSAELGMTDISQDKPYWNAIAGVDPSNTRARRPPAFLTTIGAFVRKGMWFPIPSLEWGGGAVNILQSGMWAVQGYVKLALHEGFHSWPLPSIAVRGAFSTLVGTDQADLTVSSFDLVISKAFSLAGAARVEPFAGWDFLFINAHSAVIDATPACDAVRLHNTDPADARAVAMLPASCPAAQAGTWADLGANFTFPNQSVITRNRVYAGLKIRLSILFLVAQAALTPGGRSQDGSAHDQSGSQRSVDVSTGFDF